MRRNRTTDILTALAVGVGVGAVIGLLLAPQSGEETVDYIRKNASGKFDSAMRAGKSFARKAQEGFGQAKDYVNDSIESGKSQMGRAQEGIQDRVEQFRNSAQDMVDAGQRAYRESANS